MRRLQPLSRSMNPIHRRSLSSTLSNVPGCCILFCTKKAQIACSSLRDAARALKPYTTTPQWHTRTRLLYLYADGDILTLSASTGDEL